MHNAFYLDSIQENYGNTEPNSYTKHRYKLTNHDLTKESLCSQYSLWHSESICIYSFLDDLLSISFNTGLSCKTPTINLLVLESSNCTQSYSHIQNIPIDYFDKKIKNKLYLTCCCLKTDIYNRCLYTLRKRCFASSIAPDCCLDLMKEKVITLIAI